MTYVGNFRHGYVIKNTYHSVLILLGAILQYYALVLFRIVNVYYLGLHCL